MGLTLAFCAGVALGQSQFVGSLALLFLLVVLRPRWPFHRPSHGLVTVAFILAAGALHGGATGRGESEAVARSAPVQAVTANPRVASASEAGRPRGAPGWRERAQEGISGRIAATFPQEAALVDALLLARRDGMDPGVRDAFTRTGAAHLLAISGFHVGVLAGWTLVLLRGFGASRRGAALGAAGFVWGYVALLGFPTSAVRAALLLSAAAAGRIRGRPVHALGSWGTALLMVAVFMPGSLERAGTQLSFAGALGLLVWAGPWGDGLARIVATVLGAPVGPSGGSGGASGASRAAVGLARAAGASGAAQVATLPLAVWHFQRVAVLALPATLLVTPLITLALPGALLALTLSEVGLPGSALLAAGVEGLLWAARALLAVMAEVDPGWMLGPLSVALGTVAAVGAWRATAADRRRRWRPGLTGGVVLVVVALAPTLPVRIGASALRIHVLDVGQGDAIAIQGPEGRWILVDTGPGSGERLARELAVLGVRRLDLLVLSHPDLDHIGGAPYLLGNLPVGAVMGGGGVRGTRVFAEAAEAAAARGVPWRTVRAGEEWRLGALTLSIHHPTGTEPANTPPNERSVVFTLRWGEFDALFTGDVSEAVELEILPRLGPVELLKVGHHGSRTSTARALLRRVRPELSVISVGRRNRFGHPAPEVLSRLSNQGSPVMRTDLLGRITVVARRDGSFTTRPVPKPWAAAPD